MRVVVTVMTVHKLTAGDGYTYLTRQVASADEHRAQGQSLADYYVARGNPPGVWLGKGAHQLGLAGSEVSEAQMRSLFGKGCHPNADDMRATGATERSTRLGTAYPTYAELAPYVERVAQATRDFELTNGRPATDTERARLAANEARRGRRAVAGFDLVFTPVKSVSLLWALGGPGVRAQVEAAHHEAVGSTLAWLEEHAAFTRTGHGGVAQVDTTGLLAVAFDHRESRSGDPDLHTHVAVANKVCGTDGKWRSLDARGLYALGVAASERYNTRLEDGMARRLGVDFAERPGGVAGKRPIREIVGVPHELIRHFSRRRMLIEHRYAELHAEYRATHGREPGRATQLHLAQQATLETREGKGPGRTLDEQVEDWTGQARRVLGDSAMDRLIEDCIDREDGCTGSDTTSVRDTAKSVIHTVSGQRSTWSVGNVYAETERQSRGRRFSSAHEREDFTAAVVEAATGPNFSIRIAEPELVTEAPALRRESDGESVFVSHGTDRFTTSEVLLAEDRLVAAARSTDGPYIDEAVLEASLAIEESRTHLTLDAGQRSLVEAFATSKARLGVGIGPAGSGKTTAMRAFAHAWSSAGPTGGRLVPLATSSKAAQVLGAELGLRAENMHKFLHENGAETPRDPWYALRSGDVVLVDEAGMAGTLQLDALLERAAESGAAVRLLGDPSQLAAVDVGGALDLLEHEVGASYLTELHRFEDPEEAQATMAIRAGDARALDFYRSADRISAGSRDAMLESAYDAWARDVRAGLSSVLIAAATSDVAALNIRARTERVRAGQVSLDGTELHDGNVAGIGDWVVTRTNARGLRYSRRARWVHNGDVWKVVSRHEDGSLTVQHRENHGTVRLPVGYASESVELAYAATAHRVQGVTTDTAHALVSPAMTREALYVSSTRGRRGTKLYVVTEPSVGMDCDAEPEGPRTAVEVLTSVLRRSGAESSATRTIGSTFDEACALPSLVSRYEHARVLAADSSLIHASRVLPTDVRAHVLGATGATYLAKTLASAAGRGADPAVLLRAVFDLEDLDHVRSPAMVLASRIEDYADSLGVPTEPIVAAPLPWLPTPEVGDAGWRPYLRERARLIEQRVEELGGLSAAYREEFGISDRDGLGEPPEPGTRREHAYSLLGDDRLETGRSKASRTTQSSESMTPPRSQRSRHRGPHLHR